MWGKDKISRIDYLNNIIFGKFPLQRGIDDYLLINIFISLKLNVRTDTRQLRLSVPI